MEKINREDMLELTRRMTPSRTSFTRIAGCYMDADGEIELSIPEGQKIQKKCFKDW